MKLHFPALALVVILTLSMPVFGQTAGGDAEALFKGKCAMCHGQDAAGKTPMGTKLNIPDLRSPEVQKHSAQEMTQVITKGKNKMPGYEGKLTVAQISQLTAYVRKLNK